MRKVKIITDSCSDLNTELLEKYDIDYARMTTVCDGKEAPALLTWSVEDAHELYETIRGGKRVTTAQVSMEEFHRIFKKYLDEGFDIVYIGCSSKQSGSVNTGHVMAEDILEEYPDAKIICIDSLNASIGEGMLAIEAAKLAAKGKGADEIAEHIVSVRKKVHEYVTVHTLDHLRKAGRVSGPSAFFGNILGVKPIIIADANGVQAAYKKVKGRQNSFREIVALLRDNIVAPEEQTIYIAQADCDKTELDHLITYLKNEITCKDICVVTIGPIIGASIGPDAVGVWGFGDEVTFDIEDK